MAADPRKLALHVLDRVGSGGKTLDAIMDEVHESSGLSSKRDRALLQTLVYGVLRYRSRLDEIIAGFSKKGLRKIEPKVLNILRLGMFQIAYLDRIPSSAAVNTSVELAKSVAAPWTVRFVNAVLRKGASGPLPPAAGPAVQKSIPEWLFSRWVQRFGETRASALCDTVNDIPPITIRTNTLRASRESLLTDFHGHVEGIAPTEFSPEGISFFNPRESVSDLPGFKEGKFQVQDEAAQLIGHILSPLPGEAVLDACAGLGGKTGHAAQLMKDQGVLVAMDKDSQKLLRLQKEMDRQGISMVDTCRHDVMQRWPNPPVPSFDRILLDAPCSGLGVLRRNPDAKWSASESNLSRLHDIQLGLLHQLASLVKASGILVYVVCSTEPEENESVVDEFLKSHLTFHAESIAGLPFIPEDCITEKGFFKTYPCRLSMDGFFAAKIRRDS